MRCLGWRFRYHGNRWSNLYSCQERWRSCNSHRTWVQVWEGEQWVRWSDYYSHYSHYYTRVVW